MIGKNPIYFRVLERVVFAQFGEKRSKGKLGRPPEATWPNTVWVVLNLPSLRDVSGGPWTAQASLGPILDDQGAPQVLSDMSMGLYGETHWVKQMKVELEHLLSSNRPD